MKNLFTTIFRTSLRKPPAKVRAAFENMFENAIAVEWNHEKGQYEAIFVYNEHETICRFDSGLKWRDTRTNLNPDEISPRIIEVLSGFGEIMSSIKIEKPGSLFYEFVLRDKKMNRQILVINDEGKIIRQSDFKSVYDLF